MEGLKSYSTRMVSVVIRKQVLRIEKRPSDLRGASEASYSERCVRIGRKESRRRINDDLQRGLTVDTLCDGKRTPTQHQIAENDCNQVPGYTKYPVIFRISDEETRNVWARIHLPSVDFGMLPKRNERIGARATRLQPAKAYIPQSYPWIHR